MNKHFTSLTAAILLLTLTPLTAFAEGEEQETPAEEPQYSYGLDEEGNAELYDFLPSDTFTGDLVIPSQIDGHPVDYIGNGCFAQAAGITSVTIPAGLTDMGDKVFFGCTGIASFHVEPGNPYYTTTEDGCLIADSGLYYVAYPPAKTEASYTIPAGIEEIAPGAFSFATNLKEVTVPEEVQYIDNWAFAYAGISKITMQSVLQIDDYAFAYCQSLHEVSLGSSLEKIGNAAFSFDTALQQITLPNTLTEIGQYAFSGCSLSCVTIPDSLETINYCAFGYDASGNAIEDFIIYGEEMTMAQEYATASDADNDYQNHFSFVPVENADIPYELGGGTLVSDDEEEEVVAAPADEGENTPDDRQPTTHEDGTPVTLLEQIRAGLKDNPKMQLILGIGGGVLLVLAVLLIGVFVKNRKRGSAKSADKPAEAQHEETQDEAED